MQDHPRSHAALVQIVTPRVFPVRGIAVGALLCAVLVLGAACHGEQRARTAFDGATALTYVKTQLDFGPRIPNTDGARKCGDWIIARMRADADTVVVQAFSYTTADGKTLALRNILARFRPQATDRVLYVTHWDSRPVADDDPDATKREEPMPGANDGASGVALFVELADVLKRTPPNVGVDLLFVDGEDYGQFEPKDRDVLIGSTYFAAHLPSANYQPLYGVLFDMIGQRDLAIYEEGNSVQRAPEVVQRVWQTADDLGYSDVFIPRTRYTITDDHVPLLDAGLRVIDVIDYDYPVHHTTHDTLDQLSARSFQIVGDVATRLVTGS
jgi:glutaminyl-peptide cyclotransferase